MTMATKVRVTPLDAVAGKEINLKCMPEQKTLNACDSVVTRFRWENVTEI